MSVQKSWNELQKMARACRIVVDTLDVLEQAAVPGVSTKELDKIARDHIVRAGAKPAFLGYRGYPASLCVAVNEEVVHGIPGPRKLKEGDIVGLDLGCVVDGFFGDAARTVAVGRSSDEARRLMQVTRDSLYAAIDLCRPGNRVGDLGHAVRKRAAPTVCIDHHVSPGSLPAGPRLIAPEATATAELVFDLASAVGWPLTSEAARALYVGILTDTGGFRFSNTSARALRVAAALLERGVDPEGIYESVYASAPEGRVRLTAEVLQTLVVEPEVGLAWVTVPPDALDRYGATADDLDGIVEFPRSIAGVRLALLFRQIANGRIKVSFRSMGAVDVADLAHQFGGGGHKKAAGASFEGSMADVETQVLAAAREYLRTHGERRAVRR